MFGGCFSLCGLQKARCGRFVGLSCFRAAPFLSAGGARPRGCAMPNAPPFPAFCGRPHMLKAFHQTADVKESKTTVFLSFVCFCSAFSACFAACGLAGFVPLGVQPFAPAGAFCRALLCAAPFSSVGGARLACCAMAKALPAFALGFCPLMLHKFPQAALLHTDLRKSRTKQILFFAF